MWSNQVCHSSDPVRNSICHCLACQRRTGGPFAQQARFPRENGRFAVHEMDSRVGGRYRMSFTNFTTRHSHAFGGEYLELEPGKRLRYTSAFEDPNLPGQMQTTVTLREVFCGVEVKIKQEGIPAMIPAEACYLGWLESLDLLAKLVEAGIRD